MRTYKETWLTTCIKFHILLLYINLKTYKEIIKKLDWHTIKDKISCMWVFRLY